MAGARINQSGDLPKCGTETIVSNHKSLVVLLNLIAENRSARVMQPECAARSDFICVQTLCLSGQRVFFFIPFSSVFDFVSCEACCLNVIIYGEKKR